MSIKYPCGHQCTSNCHPGDCNANDCKKKVKLACACKNRRVEISCDKMRAEKITVADCDSTCEEKKRLLEEENRKRIQKQLEIEEERNRKELEEFEKRNAPKKYKERKQRYVEEEKSNLSLKICIASIVLVILAVGVYFMIN